jgi:hypothetical protein
MIIKRQVMLMAASACCMGILAAATADETEAGPARAALQGVHALEAPGVHNLFLLGTNIFSGSAPDGEEGFAALAGMGIQTMITVDGAKPDVALARKYGMRYIHLPHGYDGIGTNVQAQLVKAAQTVSGPIYVHCHHGKHRGPAAAAVLCMANIGWTPWQAEAWLKAAGTGSHYTGLHRTVREFHAPTVDQLGRLPDVFPEVAEVSGLVDSMVAIDACWNQLKAVRQAGYHAPDNHPDLQPAHEALILREHFREAARLPEAARFGDTFLASLQSAESGAGEAGELLRRFAADPKPVIRARLDMRFKALAQRCVSCHKTFRDAGGVEAGP